jgi:hypothetical protein
LFQGVSPFLNCCTLLPAFFGLPAMISAPWQLSHWLPGVSMVNLWTCDAIIALHDWSVDVRTNLSGIRDFSNLHCLLKMLYIGQF